MRDHAEALQEVVRELRETPGAMPDVIGHRLVNGGPSITEHALVDDAVLADLSAHQDLAPIHNPPAIATIQSLPRRLSRPAAGRDFGHGLSSHDPAARPHLRDSPRTSAATWEFASTATTASATSMS